MRRSRPNTVRIIGGRWRSRIVDFGDVAGVRPTPDRVRETLFNWLGQTLADLDCLDLFAGSGALGFEAASRGARSVVMVEKHPRVLESLRASARALDAANVRLVHGDALEFLRVPGVRYDVVFVDPPYRLALAEQALSLLPPVLAPDARVYVESDAPLRVAAGWTMIRQARAGQVHYHLLGRDPDDQGRLPRNV
ncbi:MAG TPA: 16S rRNA (guanine(966)-N(2))-methyltransferase RsmD [Burkholderiales bacterium]